MRQLTEVYNKPVYLHWHTSRITQEMRFNCTNTWHTNALAHTEPYIRHHHHHHTMSHIIPKKVTHCNGSHFAVTQLCIKWAQGDGWWRAHKGKPPQKKHVCTQTVALNSYSAPPPPSSFQQQTALHSHRKSISASLEISHFFLSPTWTTKQTSTHFVFSFLQRLYFTVTQLLPLLF